ncbi:MAG: elongation factor [Oscillospiraceae bacterium]|nr:elongation factor [Oscillospiraceae bacterium]
MKQYNSDKIKNLAITGHGGSGKTSLAESMLFFAKATDRLGKISDGNTVLDYDPEEIRRKATLSLSVAPFEYKEYKINIIDTPGMFDFAAGLYEGAKAAESIVIAVSGKSGVTVGAKKAKKIAQENKKACAFFVTKLDRENSDFYKVLEELKSAFGPSVCPIVVPFVENSKVSSYINLIEMKAYQYDDKGNAKEVAIPNTEHRLEGLINAISEAVAETDEALFEKYFSGEKFTHDELVTGIHNGVKNGEIYPVFCGSSFDLSGIDLFLDGIVNLLPNAGELTESDAVDDNGKSVEIACDSTKPTVAYVFKTIADPFVGKMSFFKVVSGKLSQDSVLFNMTTGESEKIGKIISVKGKKQEDMGEIIAGDIGVVTKLSANTGDTLCDLSAKVKITPPKFPNPCYNMAIKMKSKGDESKISQGMHRLLEEDLTLGFEINNETHEQILKGLGDQHLDVAISKLMTKFGVEVYLDPPTVAYRETIRKKVKVEGKHKKQTGGHGQFGHVWIEFEPCDSEDLNFEEKVFGGSVPRGFFPAVEKGLRDSMQKGVLAGYPVVGLKATLVDGSYHPVDSSEMSFKMAAALAYRSGIPQASPVLLEPIGRLKAVVPDGNTGDLMGELNKKRGKVLGMNPAEDGMTLVEAEVPSAEMHDFTMLIRQMTQGAGYFTFDFERYDQLPSNLEQDVIEKSKNMEE